MRISKISVMGLFGVFNHQIPLDQENRITIIHSPNGYGKTTILRLVDALFSKKRVTLRRIPFNELIIDFTNDTSLRVKKTLHEENQILEYILSTPNRKPKIYKENPMETRELRRLPLSILEHEIPEIERIGSRSWRDLVTGDKLNFDDVMIRYWDSFPPSFRHRIKSSIPTWWDEIFNSVSVRLVEAQRLFRMPDDIAYNERMRKTAWLATVEAYAEDLASSIKTKLAESAALSQSLDRTFPQRLVEFGDDNILSRDELLENMERIESHRSNLIDAGLLDLQTEPAFQIQSELPTYQQRVLSVWVQDVEKKLSTYDELASKIDLFRDIINDHFLFKEIEISKEHGFVFKTPDGGTITPTFLSSGEQHELVIAYELLFKVGEGSLVLIDEPELSFHVAWQHSFLRDLQAIVELSPFDALIATHSPQIIHDRWDLTVELKGPLQDE